jgi:hypothetical protein
MPAEGATRSSRQLLFLAILALTIGTIWSLRTPPAANADRYDYVGRAWHVLRGGDADPLIVYPLRFAFAGAEQLPPENMSRPPLWPLLLVPWLRGGTDAAAGVCMSAVLALALLLLLYDVSERSFGPGAGGFAAAAWVASFVTLRGLWGGGPEIALALLLYALWTWTPGGHGRVGYGICGALYGLLPWLHPIGWPLALLAFFARSHRYSAQGRLWIVLVGLGIGLPWYLGLSLRIGGGIVPLQGYAELAKALRSPHDLGPYRSLDPVPTSIVLREDLPLLFRSALRSVWQQLLHLNQWLSPLALALAVYGARRDLPLALRDGSMLLLAFAMLAMLGPDLRLLLPLSAVAATWAGAGYADLLQRWPRTVGILPVVLLLALPWVLPIASAARPGREMTAVDRRIADPPRDLIETIGEAGALGTPVFTDSAVHAWRARRPAIFLPLVPSTLEELRRHPALGEADVLLLSRGGRSLWTARAQAGWDSLLSRSEILQRGPDELLIVRLPR